MKYLDKVIRIRRKADEWIAISADANFLPNGEYESRRESEEGYKIFLEYFKNIKFCCYPFEMHCEEDKYTDNCNYIAYDRVRRQFSIVGHIIPRCPFCGKRFPKELGLEWIHLVEEQFGEEYLSEPKRQELPQEFLTDEWWVKRGL